MELAAAFPCLLPENDEGTVYSGYIHMNNSAYKLRISFGNSCETTGSAQTNSSRRIASFPGGTMYNLSDVNIECDWDLSQILRGAVPALIQRLRSSASLAEFMVELKYILKNRYIENFKDAGNKGVLAMRGENLRHLIADLEIVGWENVVYVTPDLSVIKLCTTDSRNRLHTLQITHVSEYEGEVPAYAADLPEPFEFRVGRGNSGGGEASRQQRTGLNIVLAAFKLTLERYTDMWDMFDEIDTQTWVLEPENPTRRMTMRRIAVEKNCSIQVNVDPRQPRNIPECRILGPDAPVSLIRTKLNRNLSAWNLDKSILLNLETALEMKFPHPTQTHKDDYSEACGICYSYRLDGSVPENICDECRQCFHNNCLAEWIQAIPGYRQSFNVIFGSCPYCEKAINVEMQ
eukprot:CFRG0774T1